MFDLYINLLEYHKINPFQIKSPCFTIKTDEDLIQVKLPNSAGTFFFLSKTSRLLITLTNIEFMNNLTYRPHPNGAIDFIIYFPALQ